MESAKTMNLKADSVYDSSDKMNDGKLVKDEEIKKEKVVNELNYFLMIMQK